MIKQPALFVCVTLFLFLINSPVYASQVEEVLFEDNFTSLDTNKWEVKNNSGSVTTQNGLLLSASNSGQFPFVYLKGNPYPESGDYFIDVNYNFPLVSPFGVGFGIGNLIPEYGIYSENPPEIERDFIYFQLWGSSDYHLLQTRHCPTLELCDTFRTTLLNEHISLDDHSLTIKYIGNNFSVYVDGIKIVNDALLQSGRRPSTFWIGNQVILKDNVPWTSINIKNIKIGKIKTVEDPKVPVIILPGFGGSWEIGAILSGQESSNWTVPSFIKNYDGILDSFVHAGYVKNTDLFIFPYDWRKSLARLSDDLSAFIISKGLTGKVELIGHSMGGLVARTYAQKNPDKIDKVITAGTPHLGIVDMYGLWEGAKVWNGVWWQNVLLEIATEVNRQDGETKVSAIRRVSPSIIDLFPTFPFLVSEGTTMGIDTLWQKNTNLKNLNLNAGVLGDKLTPFWSDDNSWTKNSISVGPKSNPVVFGQSWEDGSPVGEDPFGKAAGDGMVTKQSAVGPFGVGVELTGSHSELLSTKENIGKIFQNIGLDPVHATPSTTDNRRNSFVAILRSPGTLEVCDVQLVICNANLGLYFPEFKLFILPGYNNENLVVRVKQSGLGLSNYGLYKLHLGNIDKSPDWVIKEGDLSSPEQTDFYGVKSNGEDISVDLDNVEPVVNITSPLAYFYQSVNLPVLDYSVSDNWDLNPTVIAGSLSNAEGVHSVEVRAIDKAGNTGSDTVVYTVDDTPPTVTITYPEEKTYLKRDLHNPIYSVIDNFDTSPTTVSSGWSNSDGEHTLFVTGTDKAGNLGSRSVTYTVVSPPTDKDQCKKDLWRLLRFFDFKNQGSCVSFVEKEINFGKTLSHISR